MSILEPSPATRLASGAGAAPSHRAPATWALLFLLASCTPAVRTDEPMSPAGAARFDDELDVAWQEAGPPFAEPADLPAPPPAPVHARRGSIPRTALDAVLDRGPGAFLRGVSLKPRFLERRFAGWEIVAITAAAPPFDRVDLRPGDVVASINGRPIARPNHLSDLWVELRLAEAIVVRVERSGQPFDLLFEVVNDNHASP